MNGQWLRKGSTNDQLLPKRGRSHDAVIWLQNATYDWKTLLMTAKRYLWLKNATYDCKTLLMTEKRYLWLQNATWDILDRTLNVETLNFDVRFDVSVNTTYDCQLLRSNVERETLNFDVSVNTTYDCQILLSNVEYWNAQFWRQHKHYLWLLRANVFAVDYPIPLWKFSKKTAVG